MPTAIITDSTAYLPRTVTDELNIGVVSLNLVYPERQCRELELDFDKFYAELPALNELPTTSQPAPGEVYQCLNHYLSQGYDIVGIFISSALSGTYETVYTVCKDLKEQYPTAQIEIIDSKLTAMAMGYSVLKAAIWAREGLTPAEIASRVRDISEDMRFYFIPMTLEYLRRGGRIGNLSASIGGVLDILPILKLERGVIGIYKPARGKKAAIKRICGCLEQDIKERGVDQVYVLHASAPEAARELVDIIRDRFKIEAELSSIGPVIGVHAGPGALGLIYHLI